MLKILQSKYLVLVAIAVFAVSFYMRPKGITGARPAPVPVEGKGFSHAAFTQALSGLIQPDGSIDYNALRKDSTQLDLYLGQLRATSPHSAPHRFKSNEARLAYYINAYNALTLAAVRDICPVEAVETAYKLGGFFWRISFLLGEEELSLSEIENTLIAGVKGGEAAVHFALVKAAKGYPALSPIAYEEDTVKLRLKALGEAVAGNPKFVKIEGDTVKLNQIFQWYLTDFESDPIAWLKRIAPTQAEGLTVVEYLPFDARLNGPCGED